MGKRVPKKRRKKKPAKVVYGIYQEDAKCWIGNKLGPALFTDHFMARVAAQMAAVRLRRPDYNPGPIRAKPYDGTGTKYKDDLPLTMSALQALKGLEEGRYM